jgi:hypothetical protein
MKQGLRISAIVATAALLSGIAMLGCPGTLTNKECFLQEEQARAILVPSCATKNCHNAADHTSGVDLESGGIGKRLSGKMSAACKAPLIDPGKPETSVLYNKLSDPPPCGSRMPLAKEELFPEDNEIIRLWIAGLDGSCSKAGSGGSGGTSTGGTGGTGGTSSAGGTGGTTTSTGGTTTTTTTTTTGTM